MADCKQTRKGILKSSSSFEKNEPYRCGSKEMKWDEMNILQTLHPADKDYGHMKIEEPKTPFSHYKDPEDGMQQGNAEPHSDDETDSFDADLLAKKIQLGSSQLPKALEEEDNEDEEDDDDDGYGEETEEERAKRKFFEQKRKLHYNEFYAVKLARKLMEKEGDVEGEDDNDRSTDDDDNNDVEQLQEAISSENKSCTQTDNLI